MVGKGKGYFISISFFLILSILFINFVNAEGGGVSVSIKDIDLNEKGSSYEKLTPIRMKFYVNGDPYAVQFRRVRDQRADFIVMRLDKDKLQDVSAYQVIDAFSLPEDEIEEVDVDADGISDISIMAKDILEDGKGKADIFIKKIHVEKNRKTREIRAEKEELENLAEEKSNTDLFKTENEKSSLLNRTVNWFRNLFS